MVSYEVQWNGSKIDFSKVEVSNKLNDVPILRSLTLPSLNTNITYGDKVRVLRDGTLIFYGSIVNVKHDPDSQITKIAARDKACNDWLATKYNGTFVDGSLLTILDDIYNTLDSTGKAHPVSLINLSLGTGDGTTVKFNFARKLGKYNTQTIYLDGTALSEGTSDTQSLVESSSTSSWTPVSASCETLDPDADSTNEWTSGNDYSSTTISFVVDSSKYIDGSNSLQLSDTVAASGSMWATYTPDVSEDWSSYHYLLIEFLLNTTTNVEVDVTVSDGTNSASWTAYSLDTNWFKNVFSLSHPDSGTVDLTKVSSLKITVKNLDTANSNSITLNFDYILVGVHYYSYDDAYTEVTFNEPPGKGTSITGDYTYYGTLYKTWDTCTDWSEWTFNNVFCSNGTLTASVDDGTAISPLIDTVEAAVSLDATGKWLDGTWLYRRAVTIDNTNNSDALTDYQVKISLDSANFNFSHANSDGSDIRFTDDDGSTYLYYWIESWDSTGQTAIIWVKVPSIPASSKKRIYMFYGNASATTTSDGDNTFEFFDDFENTTKFTITTQYAGTYTYSSSIVKHGSYSLEYSDTDSGNTGTFSATYSISFTSVIQELWFYLDLDVTESYAQIWVNDTYRAGWQNAGTGDVPELIIRNTDSEYKGSSDFSSQKWYRLVIKQDPNGIVTIELYDESGNLWDSFTTSNTYLPYNQIGFYTETDSSQTGQVYFDAYKARKYTDPEPSTSVGNEETGRPTIDILDSSDTVVASDVFPPYDFSTYLPAKIKLTFSNTTIEVNSLTVAREIGYIEDSKEGMSQTWDTTDNFLNWTTKSGAVAAYGGKLLLIQDISTITSNYQSDLVTNASFEAGDTTGWTLTTYTPAGGDAVSGSISADNTEYYEGAYSGKLYYYGNNTDNGGHAEMTQEFASISNPRISFYYKFYISAGGYGATIRVDARVDGSWTHLVNLENHGDGTFGWYRYSDTVSGSVDGFRIQAYQSAGVATSIDIWLDAVAIQIGDSIHFSQGVPNSTVEVYDTSNTLLGSSISDSNGTAHVSCTSLPGTVYIKVVYPSGDSVTSAQFFSEYERTYSLTFSGSGSSRSPDVSPANLASWDKLDGTLVGSTITFDIVDPANSDAIIVSGISTLPHDISTISQSKIAIVVNFSRGDSPYTEVALDKLIVSYYAGGIDGNFDNISALETLKKVCGLFQRDWYFVEDRLYIYKQRGTTLSDTLELGKNIYKVSEGRDWNKYRNHIYVIGNSANGEASDSGAIKTYGDHSIAIKDKDITNDVTAQQYAEYALSVLEDAKVVNIETEGIAISPGDEVYIKTNTVDEYLRAYQCDYIYDGIETEKLTFRTYIPTFEEFRRDINNLQRWV